MLKFDFLYPSGLEKCQIDLSNELTGEAKVNLPLKLSLPADPLQWTKRQTQNWLCWLREANDIDELDITEFNIDGTGLCSLSSEQIKNKVGLRAASIFTSTLELLQSTADLVRHSPPVPLSVPQTYMSPPASLSPPQTDTTSPISQYPSPSKEDLAPSFSPIDKLVPAFSPVSSTQPEAQLRYQTPCTIPSINRSSVITSGDIARLQPIARPDKTNTHFSPIPIEGRRSSSECESVDGDEEKMFTKYFQTVKEKSEPTKPLSNGIDCGRQGVTLWQFILELLADKACTHIVSWTENYLEFKVMNSKEMANRWGARKNRPKMNYDKLSRALRYYYRKNLIQHVPGKRQVYFFVEHPESLDFSQLLNTALRTHPLRERPGNSAFTQISGPTRGGNKRYNPAKTDLGFNVKKARNHGEEHPLSLLGYPGMLPSVNQLLSLQSPLLSHSPGPFNDYFCFGKVPDVTNLLNQQHLDYQRLAAIQAAVMAPIQITEPQNFSSRLHTPQSYISHSDTIPRIKLTKPSVVHKVSILDTGSVNPQ